MPYLAACAIYLNEAPYLQEWIEFHRLVGVEKFYLYDHLSTDDHEVVLKPYVDEGIVTVKEWPDEPGQPSAYRDCVEAHRDEARWIAFIDLDEFLFSPTLQPLPEMLAPYEQWPGVVANWAMFGPSEHETKPDGLVIENYRSRGADDHALNHMVKSIVNPQRAVRVCGGVNSHCFDYKDGFAVDEQFRLLDKTPRSKTESVSYERLRINHYYMKSREQWFAKLQVPSPQSGKLREAGDYDRLARAFSAVEDDLITAYAPALKAALAERNAPTSGSTGTSG